MAGEDKDSQQVPTTTAVDTAAPVTVFDDPMRFTVKHPLQNRWTLWFDAPLKRSNIKDWNDNLRQIVTFDNVEDFWGVFNNVLPASETPIQGNYHMFKEGIKPAWEDPANKAGGKWTLLLPKSCAGPELDQHWLYTVLACIGEHFTYGDEVCGVVVSVRKHQNRIAIWTKTADDEEKTVSIGKEFKAIFPSLPKLSYLAHADSSKKSVGTDKYAV